MGRIKSKRGQTYYSYRVGDMKTAQSFTNESAAKNFAAGLATDGWHNVGIVRTETGAWIVSGAKKRRV
jgi:hypothetical protein